MTATAPPSPDTAASAPPAPLDRWAGLLVGHLVMAFARVLTGVRPLWRGSIPAPTLRVYFANHASHGDFVLIWTTLPGELRRATRPVAGRDYWASSPLRRFIGLGVFNALLIDRVPTADGPRPVDRMVEALGRGESLILFPEGTRNTGETPLLPFKGGIHQLAVRCPQVELVPVWIDNIRRVIPKGQWLPVPMICTVTYGAPLALGADESREAFLHRAEAAVMALRPDESVPC